MATAPGSSDGPGAVVGGLSSSWVPLASRMATDGPAGSAQAVAPRFSTDTSAPRLPAAALQPPLTRARSVGAHSAPSLAGDDVATGAGAAEAGAAEAGAAEAGAAEAGGAEDAGGG